MFIISSGYAIFLNTLWDETPFAGVDFGRLADYSVLTALKRFYSLREGKG